MSLSTVNATALVRSLIKEATAKFWTDAEITLYLTAAMDEIWSKYSPWLFSQYKKWHDLGTVASTSTYTISTAIATDVFKLAYITRKEDGRELDFIYADQMYKYRGAASGTPVAWTYNGKTAIELFPTPSATDADFLEAFYMPKYTDITTFPDSLQMVVVVVAAIYAKTKDEDVTPDLIDLRNWHEMTALQDLAMATVGEVVTFPEFSVNSEVD